MEHTLQKLSDYKDEGTQKMSWWHDKGRSVKILYGTNYLSYEVVHSLS